MSDWRSTAVPEAEILPAAVAYPVIEAALARYDKKRRAGHHKK